MLSVEKNSKMPRYKITSETDLDEYFGFGEPKKTTAERHFGEQNIPSLGQGIELFTLNSWAIPECFGSVNPF